MTYEEAVARSRDWCDAWNRRDIEAVLSHYSEDVEVCSPLVVQRLGRADGTLRGKQELREYFAKGMSNPDLCFDFEDVRVGVGCLTVLYSRENGMRVSDTLLMGPDEKAVKMFACYAGGKPNV